jgi:hypothetical protein
LHLLPTLEHKSQVGRSFEHRRLRRLHAQQDCSARSGWLSIESMAPEVAFSSNRTSHQLLAMRIETCRRDGQDKGGRAEFPGGRVDDVPIGAVSWRRKLICTTARGRVLVSPLLTQPQQLSSLDSPIEAQTLLWLRTEIADCLSQSNRYQDAWSREELKRRRQSFHQVPFTSL